MYTVESVNKGQPFCQVVGGLTLWVLFGEERSNQSDIKCITGGALDK